MACLAVRHPFACRSVQRSNSYHSERFRVRGHIWEDLILIQFRMAIFMGWAKYRELSETSRSIICRSWRLRQIIDLLASGNSRYFAITKFNNCFIIRSPSLFSYFNHFLAAQGSNLPFFSRERGSNYAWAEYCLQQNTFKRYHTWADHYL